MDSNDLRARYQRLTCKPLLGSKLSIQRVVQECWLTSGELVQGLSNGGARCYLSAFTRGPIDLSECQYTREPI